MTGHELDHLRARVDATETAIAHLGREVAELRTRPAGRRSAPPPLLSPEAAPLVDRLCSPEERRAVEYARDGSSVRSVAAALGTTPEHVRLLHRTATWRLATGTPAADAGTRL